MNIKVLGSGCKSCKKLFNEVEEVVKELNVECNVEYITDMAKIMEYGIMSVPALVIDEKVVSTGKVLSTKKIKDILNGTIIDTENNSSTCSCGGNC